jgi:hypothetical protein
MLSWLNGRALVFGTKGFGFDPRREFFCLGDIASENDSFVPMVATSRDKFRNAGQISQRGGVTTSRRSELPFTQLFTVACFIFLPLSCLLKGTALPAWRVERGVTVS